MGYYFKKDIGYLVKNIIISMLSRTFAIEEYKQWLEDIGFKILEISADFLDEAPTEESERIVFVAQK